MDPLAGLFEMLMNVNVDAAAIYATIGVTAAAVGVFAGGLAGFFVGRKSTPARMG